jgi:hypothetical protein
VFATAEGKDGKPYLILGIPKGAWEHMKDGNTSNIDLTKAGIPIRIVAFGGPSHDAVMNMIQQAMAQQGVTIEDRRREDFSVK